MRKKSFVEYKIDEVYQTALKLGLENCTDLEKTIFKNSLAQIAVAMADEIRSDVTELLHQKSNRYTQHKINGE